MEVHIVLFKMVTNGHKWRIHYNYVFTDGYPVMTSSGSKTGKAWSNIENLKLDFGSLKRDLSEWLIQQNTVCGLPGPLYIKESSPCH